MTTATKTIQYNDKTIKITFSRGTWDRENRLDGTLVSTSPEIVETTDISLYDTTGKLLATGHQLGGLSQAYKQYDEAVRRGCVAMLGRAYLMPDARDLIVTALAELDAENPKSAEQIALEQAAAERKARAEANLDRTAREDAERRSHPGWCDKCHSYCYGDCTAN